MTATLRPCPACPDGSVWNSDGPTSRTCPVCLGTAEINLDGSPTDEARQFDATRRRWVGLPYRRGEDE